MSSPKKPSRPGSWFSKRQMAAVFDVSEAYFDRDIRPLIRDEHVRREAGRLGFYARGVIESWAVARAAKSSESANRLSLDALRSLAVLEESLAAASANEPG